MTNCPHVELFPPRHPGALRVCVECRDAVLDFDAFYVRMPNGHDRTAGFIDEEGFGFFTDDTAERQWVALHGEGEVRFD